MEQRRRYCAVYQMEKGVPTVNRTVVSLQDVHCYDEKLFIWNAKKHVFYSLHANDRRRFTHSGAKKLKVMVGGIYGKDGPGPLVMFEEHEKIAAGGMAEVLQTDIGPYMTAVGMHTVMFDNAAIHNAQVTQEVFRLLGLVRTKHPPHSPDFNPVELPWNRMQGRINRKLALCRNVTLQRLIQEIRAAWAVEARLFLKDCQHVVQCMWQALSLRGGNEY